MFQLIANVLAWFYGLVPNYAIAIALLTLAIMILLTPLTLKSTKSMLEMQRIQPEMRRLQAQYKGDRQKLNEEMMKLYKEHQINPLGGCLPLLLQAPVFIILFRVLNHLTQVCTQASIDGGATRCLNPTVKVGNFGASYVSHSSQLWQDLASGNTMKSFGLDLSKSALNTVQDSFVKGLPYIALVLVVAATSYYQQRQISSRNTNQVANPQQQMLLKVMPALFAVISFAFQAGLIVYFLTSNLYRIAQNAYITRRFYREGGGGAVATAGGPPIKTAPPKTTKPRPAPAKGGDGNRPTPNRPQPRPQPRPGSKEATPPAPKGNPVRGARPTPRPTPRPAPKPPPKKKK
jgi:YidC/Oxa1 family membrane protein insertase